MKTTLIVRADLDIIAQSELKLQFPAIYESHAIDRAGEDVVFARSSVPGIWEIHASRFGTWVRQDDTVEFRFFDIRRLAESITVVTEGDCESDCNLAPYLIDILFSRWTAGNAVQRAGTCAGVSEPTWRPRGRS